jgi:hypothetical protein
MTYDGSQSLDDRDAMGSFNILRTIFLKPDMLRYQYRHILY